MTPSIQETTGELALTAENGVLFQTVYLFSWRCSEIYNHSFVRFQTTETTLKLMLNSGKKTILDNFLGKKNIPLLMPVPCLAAVPCSQ